MTHLISVVDARIEATQARDRHLDLLQEIRDSCVTHNTAKRDVLYMAAIPIVYAAWEGYVKLLFSLSFRRMCHSTKKAGAYPGVFSTLWLQQEPFVDSFFGKLFGATQPGKKIKLGAHYQSLAQFSEGICSWLDKPVNGSVDFDKLVMSFSNINCEVLKLNAQVIGLDLSGVVMGRLDELLGRRNEIAHGGLLTYPPESLTIELIDYGDALIRSFFVAFDAWLGAT